MKKLAVCIFLLITVTSLAVLAFNAIPPGQDDKKLTKNGDVDYSGSVELKDAIMMFRRTAGKEVFDDFTEKSRRHRQERKYWYTGHNESFQTCCREGGITVVPAF